MNNKKEFKSKCYGIYQLAWMIAHGHTLGEFIDILRDGYMLNCSDGNIDGGSNCEEDFESILDYFDEQGFNGELFVCEDEFMNCEYLDIDYMKRLLPKDMFETYLKYNSEENNSK